MQAWVLVGPMVEYMFEFLAGSQMLARSLQQVSGRTYKIKLSRSTPGLWRWGFTRYEPGKHYRYLWIILRAGSGGKADGR